MKEWRRRLAVALIVAGTAGAASALAHREAAVAVEFGGKGTDAGQFSEASAFHGGPDGALYVADATYKRIQKFDAAGGLVLEISNATLDEPILLKPTGIAADGEGNIYVLDLNFVPVPTKAARAVFYYGHCVRKFAADGAYIGVFQYLPLEEKSPWPESALLGVSADGDLSAIVPYRDLERPIRIAASPTGRVFVYDGDTVYELDAAGELVRSFGATGGREGETHSANSMTVDATGNLYLADTKNHRVVVYDAEGNFVRAFGALGARNGEFRRPMLVSAQADGSILVGDEAVYTRFHDTGLPRRKDDPSPQVPEALLPPDQRLGEARLVATLIRRVQAFDADGRYLDKTLVRFPVEARDSWRYELRAIGPDGRLYYQDTTTLRLRVYAPSSAIAWSRVFRTLNLRWDITTFHQEVDNPDLDADLGTKADYRARGFLFREKTFTFLVPTGAAGASATGGLRFEYDWNERERLGITPGFYTLRGRSEQLFGVPAGLDPERVFSQDDQEFTSFRQIQFGVEWERTLNQDPYRYRSVTGFGNVGFGGMRTVSDATAASNLRVYRVDMRFLDWEVGFEYDLAPRLYATASLLRGPAFGGFTGWWTYVDETGALFARGFNDGRETRLQFRVEGYL